MSTERLEELGVPRRTFLKKATFAALGAPLIVSFGLDAIAEASTTPGQSKPNQCFPNQIYANQLEQGAPLYDILETILFTVERSAHGLKPPLGFRAASAFSDLAMQAALQEAAGEYVAAFESWGLFIEKVEKPGAKLPEGLAEELIGQARRARQYLNCN
jgi:hypothetical protein